MPSHEPSTSYGQSTMAEQRKAGMREVILFLHECSARSMAGASLFLEVCFQVF